MRGGLREGSEIFLRLKSLENAERVSKRGLFEVVAEEVSFMEFAEGVFFIEFFVYGQDVDIKEEGLD